MGLLDFFQKNKVDGKINQTTKSVPTVPVSKSVVEKETSAHDLPPERPKYGSCRISTCSLSSAIKLTDYVVLDVETTGFSFRSDKIIEIALIKVLDGQISDTYETLINPGVAISQRITDLTGISDEDVAESPYIEDILPYVQDFISDLPIVAHNAKFDSDFLGAAYYFAGMHAEITYVDTLYLSRKAFPEMENHKLQTLINQLGISSEGQDHRALSDAAYTNEVFQICCRKIEENKIEEAKQRVIEEIAERDRKCAYYLCQLGIINEKRDNIDKAIFYYEEAITEKIQDTHPFKRLVILYRKVKKYEDELRVCDLAIAFCKKHENCSKELEEFQKRKISVQKKVFS